jgi:hypothetical protein
MASSRGYRVLYVGTWLLTFSLLVVAVTLALVGVIRLASPSTPESERTEAIYFLYAAGFSGVLYLLLTTSGAQARYRSGRSVLSGLSWLSGSTSPSSTDASRGSEVGVMIKKLVASPSAARMWPRVVGGAWSNVLRMEATDGPVLYTRALTGPSSLGSATGARRARGAVPLRWKAGTRLADVQKELAKHNKVLVNVPSYTDVTVGAWVATMGHGMTGSRFDHDLVSVSAKVLDMATGIVLEDEPGAKLFSKFGSGPRLASQFLVLEVNLDGSPTLVEDKLAVRSMRWIESLDDASWALRNGTDMMAVFVGHTRTLAVTWVAQPEGATPFNKAGLFTDVWLALFTTTGRGMNKARGLERTEKLSKAVYLFSVFLYPIYLFFYLSVGLINFEIYSRMSLTPEKLLSISAALQPVLTRKGGRCEIRMLGELVFFDFFAWSSEGVREVLSTLASHGVVRAALHPGKYQVSVEDGARSGVKLVVARSLSGTPSM